jgi:hypothetical protein
MRRVALALAALTAFAAPTILASAAEAAGHRKPLRVVVVKRSFLDAGKLVPVGIYNRHHVVANTMTFPAYSNIGGFYGRETLPGHIGAGENPFANSFFGPTLR